jgi:hypothetical protein
MVHSAAGPIVRRFALKVSEEFSSDYPFDWGSAQEGIRLFRSDRKNPYNMGHLAIKPLQDYSRYLKKNGDAMFGPPIQARSSFAQDGMSDLLNFFERYCLPVLSST